jgi:hypothetical protein
MRITEEVGYKTFFIFSLYFPIKMQYIAILKRNPELIQMHKYNYRFLIKILVGGGVRRF